MNVGNVYREAASYLYEHGWIKGRLTNEFGERCVVGALAAVTITPEQYTVALQRANDYVRFTHGENIGRWNDRFETSIEDVFMLLKELEEREHHGVDSVLRELSASH